MIPSTFELLNRIYGLSLHMPVGSVIKIVLITVLVPLLAGMISKALAPHFMGKVVNPLSLIAILALILSALPVLFIAGPAILSSIGNGTILVFVIFTLVGIGAGMLLGGHSREHRVVLSLSAASRHPGIALAIAAANFPDQKQAILAAILLYLIVNVMATLPYLLRRHRLGNSA
jgi:BASS family bile acid:Na+ symporter